VLFVKILVSSICVSIWSVYLFFLENGNADDRVDICFFWSHLFPVCTLFVLPVCTLFVLGATCHFCCVHAHAHIILLGTIANHTSLLVTENVFVYYCQYSVLCLHWELANFLCAKTPALQFQ
jgi:hypothetical protein